MKERRFFYDVVTLGGFYFLQEIPSLWKKEEEGIRHLKKIVKVINPNARAKASAKFTTASSLTIHNRKKKCFEKKFQMSHC